MFYPVEAKKIISISPTAFKIVYLFIGGEYAGRYGLVSIVANTAVVETAIFSCDEEGEVTDWIAWAKVQEADYELALNSIGYTEKIYTSVIE